MVSLLLWLLILWACTGTGAALLRRLRAPTEGLAEEIPFAAGLGLGLLSLLMLAAGLLRQLHLAAGIALVVLMGVLGWRQAVRLLREAVALLPRIRVDAAGAGLLVFFLGAGVVSVLGALAPVTGNDYDALVYHLTIPKLYLRQGGIHSLPWLTHSNFPFGMEMLYLLGLLLRDETLAKLFHLGFGWLTALAIYAFGRRWWSGRAGALGAAAFAAVPLVGWEMTVAYNELAFTLYAFLTVYALARWYEQRDSGWLWVGAITCGLALGTKMLALAVLLFAGVVVIWRGVKEWPREEGRKGGREEERPRPTSPAGPLPKRGEGEKESRLRGLVPLLGFVAIALVVAGPWYVKTYLWTGNPVYPFFYEVFGGRYWTAARAAEYAAAQQAFGLGGGPLRFLALPWNLTMQPQAFFDQPGALRDFNVLVTVFGPLLLAFVPVLLVAGPVGRPGRLALWFALLYTALWFAMSQNGRYLLPILPGLCAGAGLAAARLAARRGVTRIAASGAYAAALGASLLTSMVLTAPVARAAVGLEPRRDFLARVSPVYGIAEWVNANTPETARIMVLGDEPRMFYLDRDFLLGNHASIFTAGELNNTDAFLGALRRLKVTHVLIHGAMMDDVAARRGAIETRIAELIARGALRPVGRRGAAGLWEVVAQGPGARGQERPGSVMTTALVTDSDR
jgi:hypothetical protein